MKKPKSVNFILSVPRGEKIPSVNALYKAKLNYVRGKPVPVIYKSGDAKKIISALTEQLKMIDFKKDHSWMFEKDAVFDMHIECIFTQNLFLRDSDNCAKLLQDSIFRHLGLNDSRVVTITISKSICKEMETEKVCVSISRSTKEYYFNKLEELPIPTRIFLGGTTCETTWREELMPELDKLGYDYFNPIVPDWTPSMIDIENDEKDNKCDCHLYIITPAMKGAYSIAEIINSAHEVKRMGTGCCLFGLLGGKDDWGESSWRSMQAIIDMTNTISKGSKKVWAGHIDNAIDILEHLGTPKKRRKKNS